jgi:phage host-nuclease inhibitor protein Gam
MITDIFEKSLCELEAEEAGERFHITTPEAADWLLRKLANIEAEKARVSAQAQKIVAQLSADAEALRRLYEGELVDFTRRTLAEAGRGRRTLHLLQGSVALRLVPASVRVSDPFAALSYAKQNTPDLVRRQETVDTAGYQQLAAKRLQESGDVLPGCESTPARETHRITFGR